MKIKNYPSDKEIAEVLRELDKKPATKLLPPDASLSDRIKFDLCKNFLIYKRENKLSQKEMCELLGIDKSKMSKICHYHIEDFSIERLVNLLGKLYKKVSIRIA